MLQNFSSIQHQLLSQVHQGVVQDQLTNDIFPQIEQSGIQHQAQSQVHQGVVHDQLTNGIFHEAEQSGMEQQFFQSEINHTQQSPPKFIGEASASIQRQEAIFEMVSFQNLQSSQTALHLPLSAILFIFCCICLTLEELELLSQ